MDHPLSGNLIPLPQEDQSHIADEPEGALFPETLLAEVHDSLNERLDVDKEAAGFLVSILKKCKQDEAEQIRIDPAILDPKRMKLELPVLANDHDVEMISLRRRHEVKLTSKGVKPFQLDTEKGESLVFSSAEVKDKQRLDAELQNEKLDVGKETVELFRELRDLTISKKVDYVNEAYNSYKVSFLFVLQVPQLTWSRRGNRFACHLLYCL
jgi:DNA-binding protein YbaB